MRRTVLALVLLLGWSGPALAQSSPAVARWHAMSASLPLRLQVMPGSPFTPGGSGGGAGASTFSDAAFAIFGNGDPTKIAKFEVDGFTTGNTRTFTLPNFSMTLAGLALAQSWTQDQTVTNNNSWLLGTSSPGSISLRTAQTPDSVVFGTSPLSNVLLVMEHADIASDAGFPLQVNPGVVVQNAVVDSTQHNGLFYYGNQGRAIKALTESTNTSAVQIPVAAGAGVGGTVTFTAFASDATDHQTLTGVLQYAAVNKAATETCATPTLTGTALNSVSTGTLTCTYACDVTPANAVNIQFNCVSSLTQTTLDLYWRLDALGASEPLPQ